MMKKTPEQKAADKFKRRWTTRAKVPIFPHGYNTGAAKLHRNINLRARIAQDIERTKDMIFRCNGIPAGKTVRWLNSATLMQTFSLFPQ